MRIDHEMDIQLSRHAPDVRSLVMEALQALEPSATAWPSERATSDLAGRICRLAHVAAARHLALATGVSEGSET